MALEVDFVDSFGHYDNQTWGSLKWQSAGGYATPGPFGSDGWAVNPIQNTTARTTWELSAYSYNSVPGSEADLLVVSDTFGVQSQLRIAPDGTVLVRSTGFTVVAQSAANVYTFNAWHHIRVRFVIGNSPNGEAQVWIDGVQVMNATGIDTRNSSTDTITQYQTATGRWAHVAAGVEFSGQPRVGVVFASGAGAKSEWTPSVGSNYQTIDEATPNVADYNSTDTAAETDLFKFANAIPSTAIILACVVTALVHKTEASVCEMALVVHPPGGADDVGVTQAVPATDRFIQGIWELNPFTVAAWTPAEANDTAFEAGYKSITVTP